MKKTTCAVLICGFSMILSTASYAQVRGSDSKIPKAVVKADLQSCSEGVPVVPKNNLQMFSEQRIKDTLHGVWRGTVSGENYGKEFLAKDGNLNVDYYMIVDSVKNEILVLEQFTSQRSIVEPRADRKRAGWSYLMCGNENYTPAHPAQIHHFEKVSDTVADAGSILETSTGLRFSEWGKSKADFALSDAWSKLVDGKYFDDLRFPAYAGGFFRQEIGIRVNEEGDSVFSLHFETELRGGGGTAAEFQTGEPIIGTESAEFVGVSTDSGDYLVASAGNGSEAGKTSQEFGGLIDLKFEQVVIGPLAQ